MKLIKKLISIAMVFLVITYTTIIPQALNEKLNEKIITSDSGSMSSDDMNNLLITSLAAFYIDGDDNLWAWGWGPALGLSSTDGKKPSIIMSNVKSITSIGYSHFVIKNDGTLWSWGGNGSGILGIGNTIDQSKPVKVMDDVKSIKLENGNNMDSGINALALKNDGTLWSWGDNYSLKLGVGDSKPRYTPTKIMSDVRYFDINNTYAMAIKIDGTLWSWGYNYYGQLGIGSTTNKNVPTKVTDNVKKIEIVDNYAMAIKYDNTLWSWGDGYYGQLGQGANSTRSNSPIKILDNVSDVKLSWDSVFAVKTDGSLYSWGYNYYGQLGIGNNTNQNTPKYVTGNVKYIETNGSTSMIIKNDNTLWSCGYNDSGQLGIGNTSNKNIFTKVMDNAKDVLIDFSYSMALKRDGSLYSWGHNGFGILGTGDNLQKNLPVKIMDNVIDFRSYFNVSGAVKKDGSVWTWGYNSYYQIGDGTTEDKDYPVNIIKSSTPSTPGNGGGDYIPPAIPIEKDTEIISTEISIDDIPKIPIRGLPLVQGLDLGVLIPNIDCMVKIDRKNDKFECIVGINNSEKVTVEDYGKYYKMAKNLERDFLKFTPIPGKSYKLPECELAKILTPKPLGLTKGVKLSTKIFGTIEGKLSTGEAVSGSINFAGDFQKLFELNGKIMTPIGIPLTVGTDFSMGTEGSLGFDKGDINGELKFAPEHKIKGGVGIQELIYGGAYGKGILEFKTKRYLFSNQSYFKAAVKGLLGLEYELLLIFKGSMEWPEDGLEIPLYNDYPDKSLILNKQKLLNKNTFGMMDRDYLEEPSTWMASTKSLYKNTTNNTMATNIMPTSQPQIVKINDNKIMVWHSDNTSRSSSDRSELLYSVFNNNTKTWSKPQSIHNDGTNDYYFSLASDGNKSYIAWQNSSKSFNNSIPSIEEISKYSEIMVAEFDSYTNKFKNITKLTDNSTADYNPKISVSNGVPFLTWINNDNNDMLGTTGKEKIIFTRYKDNKWEQFVRNTFEPNGKIISYSSAFNGNNGVDTTMEKDGYIVYEVDTDKNLETLDDREIYYRYVDYQGSGTIQSTINLTKNSVQDSNPQVIFNGDKASLYYYSENNINYIDDIENRKIEALYSKEGTELSDNFKVIKDDKNTAILWTKEAEGTKEVYSSLYDSNSKKMSNLVKLTGIDGRIKTYDGIFEEDGTLVLVYNNAHKVKHVSNDIEYYKDGQSDLCISNIKPTYDLSLIENSISWDDEEFDLYKNMNIDFEVQNNGTKTINNNDYIIKLIDKDTNEVLSYKALDKNISIGEKSNLSISLLPNKSYTHNLKLKLEPNNVKDSNLDDNYEDIEVGHQNLVVDEILEVDRINDNLNLNITVKNKSKIDATGFKINIRDKSEDGKILNSKYINNLSADSIENINIKTDLDVLDFEDDSAIIYAEIVPDTEEKNIGDNFNFIVIPKTVSEDINKDGIVDIIDLAIVASNYNTNYTDLNWYDIYDLNKDKIIDIYDIVRVSRKIY